MVHCRFCTERHRPRYLCDPASRVLKALHERGMEFNMPTLDFPEPLPGRDLGLGLNPGDQLMQQVVVMAGTGEVAGVPQPIVVLTGRDHTGAPLPRWMYIADEQDMASFRELITSRIDLAVATARKQRRTRGA